MQSKVTLMKSTTEIVYDIDTTENLLTLMSIYIEEWKHRDSMLWKQVFTYFFAILVVMIIPFANINGFSLGDTVPKYIFPIIGILLNFIYALVCYNYAARLSAVGDIYSHIISVLPPEYQRKRIDKMPFIFTMSYLLAFLFPLCLFILGILLICIAV